MARRGAGCIGRLLALAAIVALVGLAWVNRHELGSIWDRVTGGAARSSPELAARADGKLAALGADDGVDRVALDQDELQSLIQYRWTGFLPADVTDPRVAVSDGRMTLEGSVATARFDRIAELGDIVAFLPDTASLRAVASFVSLDSGHVGLEIHELGAAGIPVPRSLIPVVLERFRRSSVGGLGPNALAIPLPPGVRSVFIAGDSLVFLATRSGGQ